MNNNRCHSFLAIDIIDSRLFMAMPDHHNPGIRESL